MTDQSENNVLLAQLTRIADALERQSPPPPDAGRLPKAEAYVWDSTSRNLAAIASVNRLDLALLRGIDHQRDALLANSRAFAAGLSANNALLWGARGTGKSSLVKAVHGALLAEGKDCGLVEIHREDIDDLPFLMGFLSQIDRRFIIFSDDPSLVT